MGNSLHYCGVCKKQAFFYSCEQNEIVCSEKCAKKFYKKKIRNIAADYIELLANHIEKIGKNENYIFDDFEASKIELMYKYNLSNQILEHYGLNNYIDLPNSLFC